MLLTTDEEIGSHASRELIRSASAAAEAVLVLEPSVDGALKTARKGTSWYASTSRAARRTRAGSRARDQRPAGRLGAGADLYQLGGRPRRHHGHADHPSGGDDLQHGSRPRAPHARRARLDRRGAGARRPGGPRLAARGPARLRRIGGGIDRPAMEESTSADLFILAQGEAARIGLEPCTAVPSAAPATATSPRRPDCDPRRARRRRRRGACRPRVGEHPWSRRARCPRRRPHSGRPGELTTTPACGSGWD